MTLKSDEEAFYLEYKPKYKIFHELMSKRMKNVLLVSSIYDSFMLEEDGRLSDQIYEEFQNLNLRTLPRITRVSSAQEAIEKLQEQSFDLVITMRRLGDIDAFSFGQSVKKIRDIPVILLLTNVIELNYLPERDQRVGIDRIFVWNGDSKIFVAIIKHLEDRFNADYDTKHGQVRVFIFVDDSIRFYSLLLPEIYGEIMKQTHYLITEGANDFQDLLKMRARPKILLAETYEEAKEYWDQYHEYVMGIISDIEFPKKGSLDKKAGFKLTDMIAEKKPNLPIILQSTKLKYKEQAQERGCFFIHKRSHGMMWDLRKWLLNYVGFGEFLFRLPDDEIVGKAQDVIEFYQQLAEVPIESLIYHGKKDHFSNWLMARGEFDIAKELKPRKVSEFEKEELRSFLRKKIREIVEEKTREIINDFARENYHPDTLYLRLRPGSLGGKGRGIAFLMFLLNNFPIRDSFSDVSIEIPQTIAIGTDEFERFMEENNLYNFAINADNDKEIKDRFVKATLSKSIRDDLAFILKDWTEPLAVRSSSLLEDSAYQPFAGIFNTYMIPNNCKKFEDRLKQLFTAIKLVYASAFSTQAKSYAENISQTVEESSMAVLIQKVVGREHNQHFYPDFSGTAASYNYYPIGESLKPEDGIAHLALGLGKTIVDGELSLRFCPNYPKKNFYSTPDALLDSTQKEFYAIDLTHEKFQSIKNDPFLVKLDLGDAIADNTLAKIADTYDFQSKRLLSGYSGNGSPIITFNHQLKLNTFPMAQIVSKILDIGERTMGCSVEIEFAGNFRTTKSENDKFYILQIRPFLQQEELINEDLTSYKADELVAYSTQVSGNVVQRDLHNIVYVKPATFDKTKTKEILEEIDEINSSLKEKGTPYILIGFGRWGTSNEFLGIPAKWDNISGVKVLIEASLEDFNIDFSQGSHFFQNIIHSNIGYLHIDYNKERDFIDWNWLDQQKVIREKKFVKHIRTKKPMTVKIDGKKRIGLITKEQRERKLKKL